MPLFAPIESIGFKYRIVVRLVEVSGIGQLEGITLGCISIERE